MIKIEIDFLDEVMQMMLAQRKQNESKRIGEENVEVALTLSKDEIKEHTQRERIHATFEKEMMEYVNASGLFQMGRISDEKYCIETVNLRIQNVFRSLKELKASN